VRSYPAKLLLFGEHTVLVGSSSLAIPLRQFAMTCVKKTGSHPAWLSEYATFIKQECSDIIDTALLDSWLEGHTIESNIPIGYGLGSSGALTAAIYDICGSDTSHQDYKVHQDQMARMESFFHGKSSGFDPLVSYVDRPILRTVTAIEVSEEDLLLDYSVALVDSGKPRAGRDLIKKFMDAYKTHPENFSPLVQVNTSLSESVFYGKSASLHVKI